MKPEELMNSLEYVGEDLKAEANQTVRVRQTRSWFKPAIAAVLALLVLGSGLWLGLRMPGRGEPAEDPTGAAAAQPETEAPLPCFPVGESWQNQLYGWNYQDAAAATAALREASGAAAGFETLPVYRNLACKSSEAGEGRMTEEQMLQYMEAQAPRLGLPEDGELNLGWDEVGRVTDTDQIWVTAIGEVLGIYGNVPEFSEAADEDAARALALLKEKLGVTDPENWTVLALPSNLEDPNRPGGGNQILCCLIPKRTDPVQQLLSAGLEQIYVSAPGRDATATFRAQALPAASHDPAAGVSVPAWCEFLGNYPIISPEAAMEQVRNGAFYDSGKEILKYSTLADYSAVSLENWELVYLPDLETEYLAPFYRFLIPDRPDTMPGKYYCIYVPAVREEYLTDYGPNKTGDR